MWILEPYDGDTWLFSTKELAEDAAEFFEMEKDEYDIYEENTIDDDEIIERFSIFNFKPEKYRKEY